MFQTFRDYARLPRTVLVIAAGRILNSLGSFVVILSTPLLVSHLGMSAVVAGSWLFAAELAMLGGALLAGAILDRVNKVWVLGGSLLLNAVAFGFGGVSRSVVLVPVAMVVGYLFHGAWRPSMTAIAAEQTPAEQQPVAFSLMYFVHNIGFVMAPVAAGWLFALDPRLVFGGDGVSSVASAAVVLLGTGTVALRMRRIGGRARAAATAGGEGGAGQPVGNAAYATPAARFVVLRRILADRPLVLFAGAMFLVAFTYSQHLFALPLQLVAELGDAGTGRYAALMAVNAGLVIVAAPFVTGVTRSMQPLRGIMVSTVLTLVGFGMLSVVRSPALYLASTAVWTFGEIVNAIHVNVFVASRAGPSMRGRYLSSLPVVFAVGRIASPAVGGVVVDAFGTRAMWVLTAVMCALALAMLLRALRLTARETPPQTRPDSDRG